MESRPFIRLTNQIFVSYIQQIGEDQSVLKRYYEKLEDNNKDDQLMVVNIILSDYFNGKGPNIFWQPHNQIEPFILRSYPDLEHKIKRDENYLLIIMSLSEPMSPGEIQQEKRRPTIVHMHYLFKLIKKDGHYKLQSRDKDNYRRHYFDPNKNNGAKTQVLK